MTLVEFMLLGRMGKPYKTNYGSGGGDPKYSSGEHYWNCPHCSSSSFHTLPYDNKHKNHPRVNCMICWLTRDMASDAQDLLPFLYMPKLFVGMSFYRPPQHLLDKAGPLPPEDQLMPLRRRLWRELNEQYRAGSYDQMPFRVACSRGLEHGYISSSQPPTARQQEGSLGEVAGVLSQLSVEQVLSLASAHRVALKYGVDLVSLAEVAHRVVSRKLMDEASLLHKLTTDWQHREECTDPECDAAICREARGATALSEQEIQERKDRLQAERQLFVEMYGVTEQALNNLQRRHRKGRPEFDDL
jgi:hypothetical protein